MITSSPEAVNVALVTNTLLARAAEAITGPPALTWRAFFDFSSLCEAVVILDRLDVIEATNSARVPDALALLGREGLVRSFEPTLSRAQLGLFVNSLPEEVSRRLLVDALPEKWSAPTRSSDESGFLAASGAITGFDYRARLDDLLTQLDLMATFPSLPPEASVPKAYVMRSLGYLIVASANGLDYFPDYDRSPFVASLIKELYVSLPRKVYATVAAALDVPDVGKETLISEWTLTAALPIPPATALVLQRSRSLEELPQRLLEVRDDFSSYREHFQRFKSDLHAADTLQQRRRLYSKYRRLLEVASGPDAELVSAAESLNFAQNVVTAAASPILPTSYSAGLLLQPVEWIRRWWLRRPLAVLFRIDGKLPRLPEYRSMIDRLWGSQSHDTLTEDLAVHGRQIQHMLG